MKTDEFIKKIQKLGFEPRLHMHRPFENGLGIEEINICHKNDCFVTIWPRAQYAITTIEYGYYKLKADLPLKELYKLCFEYASTPVEDREKEKKFYLKHRWMENREDLRYLNYFSDHNYYMLFTKSNFDSKKSQFSIKEIEEIKEKYDTDLTDFDIIEVKEWL